MRLIDADALLEQYGLKNATKYGNKNAEQQHNSYSTLMMYEIADMIYDAPTIESPRPDWTPCADGLPEKVDKRLWSRDVLATIKQKTGNCFVVVAYYHYGHEQWKTDDMTDNDAIDVLAWQPLPAAWKEPDKNKQSNAHKNQPEPYNPDHIRDTTKKVED